MNATVNVALVIPIYFSDDTGTGVTGLTVTASARLAGSTTTVSGTVTERGTGSYDAAITLTSTGVWFFQGSTTVDGDPALWTETIQVVTAAQDNPVAYLAGASVEVVAPLSADATTLRLIQGDSYAAAQSRQLSWSLTGQPDLTTATVTLTIIAGETVTKTATVTSPASGSPTVTATLTKTETATLSPAKVGVYDLSAAIGSDEITLARGRVYVEGDVG